MQALVSKSGREFQVYRNSGSVSVFQLCEVKGERVVMHDMLIPFDVVQALVAEIMAAAMMTAGN